jgi:hypothetical protein
VLGAVVVSGLAIWVTQRTAPEPTVSGSGAAACHQVAQDVHGERVDDVRVVDGATAATWLSRVDTSVDPAAYPTMDRVTVCLIAGRTSNAIYVVPELGRFALVRRGPFNTKGGVVFTMIALERVRAGAHETTDAPFACPAPATHDDLDVTSTLPSGATKALLCSDANFFVPPQPLTSGVDRLVRAINATRLGYTPPDFVCSPYAGAYDYTIVFQYATGTRSATWDPCRGMLLGSFSRSGPLRLDQTYLSLLAQQVAGTPASPVPPPCSSATASGPQGVGDARRVVAARFCPGRSGGPGTVLDGQQLTLLRSWGRTFTAADSVPENACSAPTSGWPRLALTDVWGDHFSLVLMGCGRRVYPSVVNPAHPDRVIHPDADRRPLLHLVHLLGAG